MTQLDVKKIRARTGLSQTQFACLFNFPLSTLRKWEQGIYLPSRSARTLLAMIDFEPNSLMVIAANRMSCSSAPFLMSFKRRDNREKERQLRAQIIRQVIGDPLLRDTLMRDMYKIS